MSKTLEERVEDMEKDVAAVKVAWCVLKWIGYVALALAGLWAAFAGGAK